MVHLLDWSGRRLALGIALWVMAETVATANGPPSRKPVEPHRLIAKVDADRDGRVSRTEWRMQGMPVANFRRLDRDRNGFLTLRELKARPPAVLDATRDGRLSPREMTFGRAATRIAPGSKME